MSNYYGIVRDTNSLAHHGIKGQKWGVRRIRILPTSVRITNLDTNNSRR